MVRAELSIKNEAGAMVLLERLKERSVFHFFTILLGVLNSCFFTSGFPEAVYNRISGILTDHSAVVI